MSLVSVQNSSNNPGVFAVVHFYSSDNTYDVVPRKWISQDCKTCRFPESPPKTSKAIQQFQKLQSNPSSEADESWPVYEIIIIKSYDDFDRANRKASRVAKNPGDNSEIEGRTRGTRKIVIEPPDFRPPGRSLFIGEQSTSSQFESTSVRKDLDELSDSYDFGNLDAPGSKHQEPHDINNPLSIHLTSDPRIDDLLAEFRAFQETSLANQIKLQQEIYELKQLILRNLPGSNSIGSVYDGSPKWTLRSEEEIASAIEYLQDEDNFANQVTLISRIGGSTIPITVYNTLKHMISNQLAVKLRLTDKSGKLPIGGSHLARLVREAVKNFYQVYQEKTDNSIKLEVTDKKIDTIIGKWLRSASEREGGRKRKHGDPKDDKGETNSTSTPENASEDSEQSLSSPQT